MPKKNYARSICNHIFTDDHRCGSPALRGERFCYFHHPSRKPVANTYARRARRGFQLPAPVTPADVHYVACEVVTRLAANRLDVHRARLILYTLQIAVQNLSSAGGAPSLALEDGISQLQR